MNSTARAILLPLFAAILSCAQIPQIPAGETNDALMTSVLALLYMDTGNCARSYKVTTNSGQLYCSNAPRSICNYWEAFFYMSPSPVYGKILVSGANQTRYRAEWGFATTDYPSCATAAAAATNLSYPGFKTQTAAQISNATTLFSLTPIADCTALGNSNIGKLATKQQFEFLVSPKGVLAWQAKLLGQQSCFDSLQVSNIDKQTATDYVNGNIILETVCNYGSSAAPNNCTSAEKAVAYPFDFTGAL